MKIWNIPNRFHVIIILLSFFKCMFAFVIFVQFNNHQFHVYGSKIMNVNIKLSVTLEHSKYKCFLIFDS